MDTELGVSGKGREKCSGLANFRKEMLSVGAGLGALESSYISSPFLMPEIQEF